MLESIKALLCTPYTVFTLHTLSNEVLFNTSGWSQTFQEAQDQALVSRCMQHIWTFNNT